MGWKKTQDDLLALCGELQRSLERGALEKQQDILATALVALRYCTGVEGRRQWWTLIEQYIFTGWGRNPESPPFRWDLVFY
jgi:hypothetical protein